MKLGLSLIAMLAACDTVDDRPATWSYIHAAILAPSCATANCHSRAASTAGIDLSSRDGGYVFITGRVCGSDHPGEDPPGNYAFAGHPERSPLMHMLRGDADRLMPPDQPLPEPEIDLVEAWILEGTRCD